MVNYYYARKEKVENGQKYLEVPVFTNPETAKENGQRLYTVKICGRKYLCTYVWIPEAFYHRHKCMLEQDAKADERNERCLVPDPKGTGGRIRCPEENRCIHCPYVGKWDFDTGADTSFDALVESGFDAETGEECESDFDVESLAATPEDICAIKDEMRCLNEKLDTVATLLTECKEKYGIIFSELRNGETNASEIARKHGLKPNRTAEDIPKVQALAWSLYVKMK